MIGESTGMLILRSQRRLPLVIQHATAAPKQPNEITGVTIRM
jgi:hypothetical protein